MEGLGSHRLPDGILLRRGYTTGTCAAAAAKAALWMLANNKIITHVEVPTPAGVSLNLSVLYPEINSAYVSCGIKKDAGDDPDITNGTIVYARVEFTPENGIFIEGGEGIGRVTKPGLALPVGASAINPVPREQIKSALKDIMVPGKGVKVTISIPGGEQLAGKTLNPSLGIEGGLSILGTSGIVEPMSEESFKKSLVLQIPVAVKQGFTSLVLTPGRRGQRQAVELLGLSPSCVLQMSNFVGYMLDSCTRFNIKEVLLCGSLGKLAKISGGIFHTHSRVADGRREIMAAYAALEGAPRELINELMENVTAEGAAQVLEREGLEAVFNRLAEAAGRRAQAYVHGSLKVGTIILNYEGKVLGFDRRAVEIGGRLGCAQILQ